MTAATSAVLAGGCRPAPPSITPSPTALRPLTDDVGELAATATRIRRHAVRMISIAGLGYLGQATSSAEIFAVMYRGVLRHGVDRLVLSPGHYAVAHYAAAVEAGLLTEASLATYGVDGTWLESISTERTPLVAATCGALGQGLSVAVGLALAAQLAGEDRRTFAFCSDGELEEGQTWEAALFAAHRQLGDLSAVVDCNGSQVDGPVASVTTLEPIADKWRAFGWDVHECDGHDVASLMAAFAAGARSSRPSIVLARTEMRRGFPSLPPSTDTHFVTLGPGDLERLLADTTEVAR